MKCFAVISGFTLLLLTFNLNAKSSEPRWTAELTLSIASLESPTISPDGKWIAYLVKLAKTEKQESRYHKALWLVSADGQTIRQMTHDDQESASSPIFSPDSQTLYFLRAHKGAQQLWAMSIDGGEAKTLTRFKESLVAYQPAPDGQKMAFLLKDVPSEELQAAQREKRDAWVVDSSPLYTRLYVTELKALAIGQSTDLKPLSPDKHEILSCTWSPDSQRLALTFSQGVDINSQLNHTDLLLYSLSDGSVKELVNQTGQDKSPLFSPDGKRLAYVSSGGSLEPIGLTNLHIVDWQNGQTTRLPPTPDQNLTLLGWDDSGKGLLFKEHSGLACRVYRCDLGSQTHQPLTRENETVSHFDYSHGKLVYVAEDFHQPQELYLLDLSTHAPAKQLSRHNQSISLPRMGEVRRYRWLNSQQMEIEGILSLPQTGQSKTPVPLIVNIHGGPAWLFTREFTGKHGIYVPQLFNQAGYAVLMPNPRGSTGYGKTFRYANIHNWGIADLDDIMSGIDSLIQKGIVDQDKLFIMGWSYGGYLTSYTITQSQRFKAASVGAGVTELVSMALTNDIHSYLNTYMGSVEYWQSPDSFHRHNPMTIIQNVATPTQILHGVEDLRVPYFQGQALYNALKRRGVETEWVSYPRTAHVPHEPKLTMDITPRIIEWFNRHNPDKKNDRP